MLIRENLQHCRKEKKPPYMGWYGRWIFPYIEILVTRGLGRIRRRLLSRARGRVVEIGAGSAQNMKYLTENVDSYLATDPSPVMVRKAGQEIRRRPPGFGAKAVMAEAERMPVENQSADTVVSFLVLCSVHDPFAALAEVHRILRPGGSFLFFEHVLAPVAYTARWQNRINPVWKRLACGCHLNRDTADYIEKSGFSFEELLRYRSSKMGPAITSNVIEGSAGKNRATKAL
ncbi:MAG: class I SAM-dependent methyltransferase [Desulfosalsimonas sp.]